MTPKERAAMQQALEALKDYHKYDEDKISVAMSILQEALDQPVSQEPAATDWDKVQEIVCDVFSRCISSADGFYAIRDLVDTAPQPVSQEQNSMFMEGYRIGLAEMREKCATVSEQGTGEAVQKTALELLLNERKRIAAAIRAIKFEGDTGFRPVSEMIAEHKQDPKKGAAIEKAKVRKATRAEKIAMPGVYEVPVEQAELKECRHCGFLCAPNPDESRKWYPLEQPVSQGHKSDCPCCGAKSSVLPMAFCRECKSEFWPPQPVRTKDLTDDEIEAVWVEHGLDECDPQGFARAVIAADRENNK